MVSMIVAGATGAIGRTVVQYAIQQPSIDRVVALTRFRNTAVSNYEHLFGIIVAGEAGNTDSRGEGANSKREKGSKFPAGTVTATPAEAAKIRPITMDWEEFTQLWVAKRSSTCAAASGADNRAAGAAATAITDPMERYRGIFGGHTYAAMCLGTTRKDAGSAKSFTRCDYDYVMAFTEAVLAYSAPAGLSPDKTFVHHIGDGGVSKQVHVQEGMGKEVDVLAAMNDNAAQSSGTLRVFCQVSSSNASSSSWFLYMKTKGIADESTVERVHRHNKLATAAAALSPVNLLLLQPGLLERHGKTRTTEKFAKLIMSSIPVETCGAAIVSACKSLPIQRSVQRAEATSAAELAKHDEVEGAQVEKESSTVAAGVRKTPLGKPYVGAKALRKAGIPSNEPLPYIYEANNAVITDLASRLTA
ncbi:hypothetical protein, conserved [Leishmania donovani]|uniref:Uncharacterized protein n=1 Tax=Leishmania donovani TaxID=5661 RepID=A0A3S7WRX1_LEIDO|nr:hypothetical protein, conserved [Leishmania donovani]AYU76950.1 hypothetical protein LdCL_120009000 [Leishmania donovani]TPP43122.1 hypothetical protein CGC21_9875 [Leishmania donovani]CBZ32439.1 hypothetical protein, conserved [Leishmania donovani]